MARQLPAILANQFLRSRSTFAVKKAAASRSIDVPRGFFAVYIREMEKKRYVVPMSYLYQPSFQDLLNKAEEVFGFDHPMGSLKIPCREDLFMDIISSLNRS